MRLHLALLLSAALLPSCAADEATAPPAEPADAGASSLAVATTDLGDVLVDGDGRTLYLFVPDERGASTCYEECAQRWPPVPGPAEAGDGADAALLGTVERDDGAVQATYGGWPLYAFADDQQPGDTNGQGVGEVWYVVSPSGEPVGQEAADASMGAGG